MSQAKDESSQSPPEAIKEDEAKGFHIPGGPGINHVAPNNVDTVLCDLVTPSSLSRSPLKHPDNDTFVVELGLDFDDTTTDEYSGNPNSSEVSGCIKNGSGCSGGYYDDSEEDRPGSFDYMPSQSGHVRITNTFNPPYDEDVKLDSSIGSSSTVESPRSEDDSKFTQDDCGVAEKEDTSASKETCPPHSKHKHPCWDYMPCGKHSDDEDMEDEEDERDRKRGLGTTSSSFMSSFPRTDRQVDECVSYNLKPLNGPGTGYTCQEFMPNPYSSYHDPGASDGGKKDRKKSRSKDDIDKPDVPGQVDINGNPRQLDSANYLQMRQWPRGKSPSSSPAAQSGYTSIAIPPSANSFGADPNAFDRKKERRRMKLERLKGTPAEAYKGHRKFSDIEEILDFVEGPNTPKSENKSTKKRQERSRKKDHHIDGPLTLEDSAEGEDAPRQEEEPAVVTTETKPAERAMGNSFRREVGENSITRTWSEDDVDKNNDFHDCLNTVPAELVTSETELVTISNREQCQQSSDTSRNNIKSTISSTLTQVELTHQTDSLSSWDSNTEKHSTDNSKAVIKKPTKSKSKREKQDATDISEPTSPKFNMVKSKETLKESILVASLIHSGSVKLNNSMDKERHPDVRREDSFTEVKKKKKRIVGKDPHAAVRSKFMSSSYHPHINNIHPHHSNRWPQTSTPPSPPVVSSIAASLTSSTSWPSSNQTHSPRDLSPSAFPVLSSQGPPLTFHTEARRNSCGDLNSDSVDSKIYDSDRESAKSLPAAHGARIGGELSPIYPVSYARMAAVLPKNDSTTSPNSESGVASISRNSSVNSSIIQTAGSNAESGLPPAHSNAVATPERKATVWKGSPRERRHSIGSSPEDIVDGEKSSVAERNRQCGSQEVLSRSLVACVNVASKDVTESSSPVRLTHHIDNSSRSCSSTDTQKVIISPLVKCPHVTKLQNAEQKMASQSTEYATIIGIGSQTGPTSAAFRSGTVPPFRSGTVPPFRSGTVPPIRPGTVPPFSQSSVTTAPSVGQENVDDEHNSRITKTCAQTFKQSGSLPMADNSSKSAFNKNKLPTGPNSARKSGSLKSVIFMDKRFDSLSSSNLGITFGFDSSQESKCEPASQPSSQHPQQLLLSQPPPSSAPPSSLSPSSSRDTSAQTSLQCQAVTQEHPHIPSKSQIAAALPNPPPSNSSPSKSGDDNNSHVPKGPHIRGPCNGLILPSSPSGNYSIPQDQAASCGSSACSSIDNNQDLTAPQRTSLTGVISVDAVQLNVNSIRNSDPLLSFGCDPIVVSRSDPLVPTRLSSPTATTLTDNPLPLVNVSKTDTTSGKPSDTVAHNDSTGVTFAATSSEPLSQTVATEHRDHTDCSTLSLPSAQENKEHSSASQGSPTLAESILRESTTSLHTSTNLEESKDILEAPVPSNIAVTPSPTTEAAPQQPPPTHSDMLDLSKPVVYGLKIKPSVGCGKLLFVPSNISKKSRGNSSEISSFLTKRWSEGVVKQMGSGAFITLDED